MNATLPSYHQQYPHKNPGGYCNHGLNGMRSIARLCRREFERQRVRSHPKFRRTAEQMRMARV